ncbi:hypothetical protein GQ44DRAFT_732919 [Phaeosphaeriaceae sp. PMI808]|nr:hypothetical protein GQ44DRAFT_732919 [Phaeosphaeriaceae sp. PMI808]
MASNSTLQNLQRNGISFSKTDDSTVPTIQTAHNQPSQPPNQTLVLGDSKTILLIGSTGFLGPYVLASLLKVHPTSTIICLNRSANGQQRTESALQKITGNVPSQVLFLVGNISNDNFALENVLATTQVDEIIFSAWDVNWSKPLEHFDPFIKSVRNVINFCSRSLQPTRITYISSVCAVGDWPIVHSTRPIIPEEVIWDNRCAMTQGYAKSKCVAEQVLAEASKASLVPVNIVRVGQIGGPSQPSAVEWPIQGWIYTIIMTSKKTKRFPMHVHPVDWIPVDNLADGIANATKRCPVPRSPVVFNMVHPKPASWALLYNTLRCRFGLIADATSLPQWLDILDPEKTKLYAFLKAGGYGRESNMSFATENASAVLPSVEPITGHLLETWLQGWGVGNEGKSKL